MPVVIFILATAVFAQATSEFMLAGLLPDIADDLGVTLPAAGLLTSAFAVGMIVGAPTMAALGRRWSPRWSLTGFLVLFIAAHVVGALTASFELLLITRFIAAVANAGFLAVTLSTVNLLVRPELRTRAIALVLAGTTLALIAGVPGGAALGAVFGWRSTLWAVALVSVPAVVAVAFGAPVRSGEDGPTGAGSLRSELATLKRPVLITALALGILVNGATFGAFTYLAPLAEGIGGGAVTVLLAVFGLGAFGGVTAAGRFADTHTTLIIGAGGVLLCGGWVMFALTSDQAAALFVMSAVQGFLSFLVGSTLIARIMHHSAGADTMGGAYATVALNVGAAAGPVLGGLALESGDSGPAWASACLVATAVAIVLSRRVLRAGPV